MLLGQPNLGHGQLSWLILQSNWKTNLWQGNGNRMAGGQMNKRQKPKANMNDHNLNANLIFQHVSP